MTLSEAELVAQALPDGYSRTQVRDAAVSVRRAVILKTLWYPEILNAMVQSAKDYLISSGVNPAAIEVETVPGSFELPLGVELACSHATRRPPPDLVVALGCVLRGGTPHFEFVSRSSIDGLMRVQLDRRLPLGMGVLTVDNKEQALERKIKGAEAAQAAFFMYLMARDAGVTPRTVG